MCTLVWHDRVFLLGYLPDVEPKILLNGHLTSYYAFIRLTTVSHSHNSEERLWRIVWSSDLFGMGVRRVYSCILPLSQRLFYKWSFKLTSCPFWLAPTSIPQTPYGGTFKGSDRVLASIGMYFGNTLELCRRGAKNRTINNHFS
jgi:hypothetical protein